MLPNLLVDGEPGLLRSLSSDQDGLNLSVLSVIPVALPPKLCPKFGTLKQCVVPLSPPKELLMLVIVIITLQELLLPSLPETPQLDSLLSSHYGLLETLVLQLLLVHGTHSMISNLFSPQVPGLILSKDLLLLVNHLLQPLLIPSPVLPEPPLLLPPAPPSSPSPLSTETECRA